MNENTDQLTAQKAAPVHWALYGSERAGMRQ